MAVYKVSNDGLEALESTSFEKEKIRERFDLQRLLRSKIEFLAPGTLVLAEEFGDWDAGRRRIDLLAIDKQANLVVIELKRDDTGAHMELQAIRYAAMVSTMTFQQAVAAHASYLSATGGDPTMASQSILDFLEWDEPLEDDFASDVRIVLVSAEFSKELTTAVLWLNKCNLDIRCVRLSPCKSDGVLFLDVQQVIPLPEAEEYQVRIRKQETERRIAGADNRDRTKYIFEGELLSKRRLVLGMVKAFVRDRPAVTIDELEMIFPQAIRGVALKPAGEARALFCRPGAERYFSEAADALKLADGNEFAVAARVWNTERVNRFLEGMAQFGYRATPEAQSASV